jgi:hypothetical protein
MAKDKTPEELAAERQKGILDGLEELITDYKTKKAVTNVPKPADPPNNEKPKETPGFFDLLFGK